MFQFIFMPLIAFGLGFVFPSSAPEMRLGLFVTGTVPGCSDFYIPEAFIMYFL
jgi:predicted Na+-dependent transporter